MTTPIHITEKWSEAFPIQSTRKERDFWFFVSCIEKFQIPEYRKVAILPQGPVTKLIWPPTWKNLRLQGLNDSFKILTCDESCPILFRWHSWVPESSQDHLSSALCFVLELLREHFGPEAVLKTREILPVVLRATYPEKQVALTKSK